MDEKSKKENIESEYDSESSEEKNKKHIKNKNEESESNESEEESEETEESEDDDESEESHQNNKLKSQNKENDSSYKKKVILENNEEEDSSSDSESKLNDESISSTDNVKNNKLYDEKEFNETTKKLRAKNEEMTNLLIKEKDSTCEIHNDFLKLRKDLENKGNLNSDSMDEVNINIDPKKFNKKVNEKEEAEADKDEELLNELLNNPDTANMNKDSLLNLLMKKDEKNKNPNTTNLSSSKKKDMNTSSLNASRLYPGANNNLTQLYMSMRPGSDLSSNNININPEKRPTTSIKEAKNKIIEQILEGNEINEDLEQDLKGFNLLIDENDINDYKKNKGIVVDISKKNKEWLDKRNEKLKKIEKELKEKSEKDCTFTPNNINKKNTEKRKLDEFIQDQEKFKKKKEERILEKKKLKEDKEAEKCKKEIQHSNIQKQLMEKVGSSETRLYNNNELKFEKLMKIEAKLKDEETKKLEKDKIKKKSKVVTKSISEINSNLYEKEVNKRKRKEAELNNKDLNNSFDGSSVVNSTNKFLFNKFSNDFNSLIKNMIKQGIIHDKEKDKDRDFDSKNFELNNIELDSYLEIKTRYFDIKINLKVIIEIMQKLGFLLIPTEKIENVAFISSEKDQFKKFYALISNCLEFMNIPNHSLIELNSSTITSNLSPLIDINYSNYTNPDYLNTILSLPTVKIGNFYKALLAIIGLYEYYESKDLKLKLTNLDSYLSANSNIQSKIVCKDILKLGGFDENNIYFVSFVNVKTFMSHFKVLCINYSKLGKQSKKENTENNNLNIIGDKTSKIKESKTNKSQSQSQSQVNKVEILTMNKNMENKNLNNNKVNKISNVSHIVNKNQIKPNIYTEVVSLDRIQDEYNRLYNVEDLQMENPGIDKNEKKPIILDKYDIQAAKKKNKVKYNEQQREINENKKNLENCTFKPQINPKSTEIIKEKDIPFQDRIEMMYNKGKKNLLNKKDKTTEEIEVEKSKGEMTFKPNINKNDNVLYNQQLIENYNINDYDKYNSILEKFSDRMKNGRIEREIKGKALERFASPNRDSNNKTELKELRFSTNNNNTNLKILNTNNSKNSTHNDKQVKSSLNNNNSKSSINNNIDSSKMKNNLINIDSSKDSKYNQGKYFGNLDYNSINEKDYNQFSDSEQKDTSIKKENKASPILVIDVNLDQNNKKEKKQILVYNGDTPINLAKKFSKENSKLNNNIRFKS